MMHGKEAADIENEEKKARQFFQDAVDQVSENVTRTLLAHVDELVASPGSGHGGESYLDAMKSLTYTINNETNQATYNTLSSKVSQSVHVAFNQMADQRIETSKLIEIKALITENVMNAFLGLTGESFTEDAQRGKFGREQASEIIRDRVSQVLKPKQEGLQDRIQENLKNLFDNKRPLPPQPDTSTKSDSQKVEQIEAWKKECQKVTDHNKFASDMRALWEKKVEEKKKLEEDSAAAAQSTPGAPKKKKEEDHGPSRSQGQHAGAKQESLPEQLWNRAMYEDKTILMALALDIFLLLPMTFVSFLGRATQYGWRHAALMTAGLEPLTESDPGLDVFIREQIFGPKYKPEEQEQRNETPDNEASSESSAVVNKDNLLRSGAFNPAAVPKLKQT